MDINIEEGLSAEDEHHLMRWSDQVFPAEGKGIFWSAVPFHVVARIDREPIAHLGFGEFLVNSTTESLKVVGVGGVVVRPEHQGKNIPSTLFNTLHHADLALGISNIFSLFCPNRLTEYYEKQGYTQHKGCLSYWQTDQQVKSTFCFMYRGKCGLDSQLVVPSNPW